MSNRIKKKSGGVKYLALIIALIILVIIFYTVNKDEDTNIDNDIDNPSSSQSNNANEQVPFLQDSTELLKPLSFRFEFPYSLHQVLDGHHAIRLEFQDFCQDRRIHLTMRRSSELCRLR